MSVYRTLLGASYDTLPARIRALHDRGGTYTGSASIEGEDNAFARAIRTLANLPSPVERCPLVFELRHDGDVERWTRRFGDEVMTSTIAARDGLLVEKLGLSTLRFRLEVEQRAIRWRLVSAHGLAVPLPRHLFDGVAAREFVDGRRYAFAVEATLPFAGLVVRYRGSLDVD